MIVACGPEANGTKLLSRILATSGEEVVHRSLPHGDSWWSYADFPEGTKFFAIFRELDYAIEAAVNAGHAPNRTTAREEQIKARAIIARIPGVCIIDYEQLKQNPDEAARFLSGRLGKVVTINEHIYDANAKYATRLERNG